MASSPVCLYFVTDHWVLEGARHWLGKYVDELRSQSSEEVSLTDDPAQATHILFLDAGRQRTRFWTPNHLRRHQLVRAYPEKSYIWCTEDQPASYLPGLYVSMPRRFFDPQIHRAFRYFKLNTERLPVPASSSRDLLYCFLGAPTATVRRKILALPHPADALVQEKLNYNHQRWAEDDVVGPYVEVLARSKFTLCPPGSATSSYRLFEAMRAGSVPVIISDELVLPEGPDWQSCSVRVGEAEVSGIEKILRGVPDPEAIGRSAQVEFGRFFSAENMLRHLARELMALGPANQRLSGRNYRRSQAATAVERVCAKLRRGTP